MGENYKYGFPNEAFMKNHFIPLLYLGGPRYEEIYGTCVALRL